MSKTLKVISNSTPIISLSKINKLNILKELYNEVIIPKAVYNEINIKKDSKARKNILDKLDYIKIIEIENVEAKKIFQTALHQGEVEVMILANEIKTDLCIIDDLLARKYAKYLGLKITGTLGVLIKAKEKRIIKEVKPLINELIKNNIYIDKELFNNILKIAKEK